MALPWSPLELRVPTFPARAASPPFCPLLPSPAPPLSAAVFVFFVSSRLCFVCFAWLLYAQDLTLARSLDSSTMLTFASADWMCWLAFLIFVCVGLLPFALCLCLFRLCVSLLCCVHLFFTKDTKATKVNRHTRPSSRSHHPGPT